MIVVVFIITGRHSDTTTSAGIDIIVISVNHEGVILMISNVNTECIFLQIHGQAETQQVGCGAWSYC